MVIAGGQTLAGDTTLKYAWRKVLGMALLAGCFVAAALGFGYWTSQCPVDLRLEKLEPGGMVDNSWIATLSVSNPGSAEVHLNTRSVRAEARAAERWVGVTNVWTGMGWLLQNRQTTVLLLVPSQTEACRVRLQYSMPTMRERLITFTRLHPIPSSFLASRIDRWLWPSQTPGWVPPPRRWAQAQFLVNTPRELGEGD
jgi:hypothetical protein